MRNSEFFKEAPCLRCSIGQIMHDQKRPCAAQVPIFECLDDEQLWDVMKVVTPRKFPKDSLLFSPGEESNSLNIIRKGFVRVYTLNPNGRERVIRLLRPGDITGELALTGESKHQQYALALSDVHVCSIMRDDFRALLLRYPDISLRLLAVLSKRLEEAENQASEMAVESVETRLAGYLLEQKEVQELTSPFRPHKDLVELKMKRKDIASFLGMSPETLSRKLSEFEDQKLIRQLNLKEILILNEEGLRGL